MDLGRTLPHVPGRALLAPIATERIVMTTGFIIGQLSLAIGQLSLALALLGAAAVFGTDTFFCVVGRAVLTRVSDAALVETMGRLHQVADRRMPIFGVVGIFGALASIAASRAYLPWALIAVTAQVLWIVIYRRVAAPVNAELIRHACAGSVPVDARALQARWDSVIVVRVLLMGFALIALTAALVRSARAPEALVFNQLCG